MLFPTVALSLVGFFLVAPWPFEHKAHAILHGLCAQRPSHTLLLGGRPLPFDARMTGIYGGVAVAAACLALRRRHRSFAMPPRRVVLALALFVAVMAIDGTNALLLDLGLPHPYPPDNRLRLATGLLTGTALAVVLCFVLATTLWRDGRGDQAPVARVRELLLVAALQLPLAAAALSGAGWLFLPVAALLLLSAVAVVGSLLLVVVVLVRGNDRRYLGFEQLHDAATVALLLGLGVMALFAGGRFLLEWWTDAPPMV